MFSTASVLIILFLAATTATFAILASAYRQRAREAEARTAAAPGWPNMRERLDKATKLNPNQRKYLDSLADRYGFRRLRIWTLDDAIKLTARLNQELSELSPAAYNAARTPWLLPVPATLRTRALEPAQTVPLDLTAGMVEMPASSSLYQYSITNTSSAPAPMPILYQGVRWDTAESLLETSGLRAIPDELDKALAIWKFVATHRVHGQPVTEGPEEHDLIKFLVCHGYGFCDDSAQAIATLADACGLKARIRGLNGHVVPEVMAGGKWRMLDADFAVYFHAPGDPREVLGVEALEQDRAAFAHAVSLGAAGPWNGGYADPFVSRQDNKDWLVESRRTHAIAHILAPGEKVTFSNFNWGRYFIGAFPQKPPRFYNGTFERPLRACDFQAADGVKVRKDGDAIVIENPTGILLGCAGKFQFPFPIVSGRLAGLPGGVTVDMLDGEHRAFLRAGAEPPLDGGIAQLSPTPTYSFTLRLLVPPGKTVRVEKPLRLIADFQFAELALLKLRPGQNTFQFHGLAEGLRAEVRCR